MEIQGYLKIVKKKKQTNQASLKGLFTPIQPLLGVNLHGLDEDEFGNNMLHVACQRLRCTSSRRLSFDAGDSWDWSIGQGRNTWWLEYLEYPLVI